MSWSNTCSVSLARYLGLGAPTVRSVLILPLQYGPGISGSSPPRISCIRHSGIPLAKATNSTMFPCRASTSSILERSHQSAVVALGPAVGVHNAVSIAVLINQGGADAVH